MNDDVTTTLTIPADHLGHTFIDESPIQSIEVVPAESEPPAYEARVVSGIPRGSGCSQFNGYEIRRAGHYRIDVRVTHHEVADPDVVCTADFPIIESAIPLGSDFEPGKEYTVSVNSDATTTFVAR